MVVSYSAYSFSSVKTDFWFMALMSFLLFHFSGSKDNKLDWRKRYKIALGTADGLLYLHENCQRRIIHRDIKADNILLTEDFEPQVSLNPKNH